MATSNPYNVTSYEDWNKRIQNDVNSDSDYQAAKAKLADVEAAKPTYAGTYDNDVANAYNNIINRDKFQYKYLDLMKNQYRGRTARFERNGHLYYAKFDQSSLRKPIFGDNRSSSAGSKALIRAGADGDIFVLVENSRYSRSAKNRKNHTKADYFDYFVKTVQIDGKVYDLVADVEKTYNNNGGFVYTLALVDNNTIKASPATQSTQTGAGKTGGNASAKTIPQAAAESKTQEQNQVALTQERNIDEVTQDVKAGKAVVPNEEVQFSRYYDEEYMNKAITLNNTTRLVSDENMESAQRIRKLVQQKLNDPKLADKLKLPEDNVGNTFLSNSSYGGSEENTTVCVRSLAAQALMDYIAKDIGAPLTIEDTLVISQEMMTWLNKPECVYCYVATDRRAYRQFLGDYIRQRDAALK